MTPDGRRAVSGCGDNTIRVWDLESGQCLRTLGGHPFGTMVGGPSGVLSLSVTPDGRRAVSGYGRSSRQSLDDNTLTIWDLESGECVRRLRGHSNGVCSVGVTSDGRCAVSGSLDNTLRVWDVESGRCLHVLEGHKAVVEGVSVTPDGRRAVSGSRDRTLRVWDLKSGECLGVCSTPSPISSVALAGRGNTICIGTTGEVILLDVLGIEPGPDLKPDAASDSSDSGYEQLLRRGLEFSRREKGNGHEETRAHLVALAVHLERMGKPAEARLFAEERDRLAAKRAKPAKPWWKFW